MIRLREAQLLQELSESRVSGLLFLSSNLPRLGRSNRSTAVRGTTVNVLGLADKRIEVTAC
jgi:hypothetical protein